MLEKERKKETERENERERKKRRETYVGIKNSVVDY